MVRESGRSCTLIVFIDDAASKLLQLRFVRSESTFSYFEALELYLKGTGWDFQRKSPGQLIGFAVMRLNANAWNFTKAVEYLERARWISIRT